MTTIIPAPVTYGVRTEYDYNADHKRFKVTLWSGSFYSTPEGEALALPSGVGWSLWPFPAMGGSVRVLAPTPRTEDNYREVDAALSDALNQWYIDNGYRSIGS